MKLEVSAMGIFTDSIVHHGPFYSFLQDQKSEALAKWFGRVRMAIAFELEKKSVTPSMAMREYNSITVPLVSDILTLSQDLMYRNRYRVMDIICMMEEEGGSG